MATAKKNPFDDLRINTGDVDRSINWYKKQINDLGYGSVTPSQILRNTKRAQNRLIPGQLYLYSYDPKYKDTLPYYDTFPLVYPYALTPDGFMGYNLHYLPPTVRVSLMRGLVNISTSNAREDKKTSLSFSLLNSASSNKYLQPCIKRYLKAHVMSRFMLIPQDAWISAAVLPLERFVNSSKQKVWRDTLSKV